MTYVSKEIENRNEAGGASLGKAAPPPAEWGPNSCLCGVHLPLVPPGAALGGMPSRARASSPLGLVVTAAPGPQPGWLWPGRRRSEVWEASAGPTAAPGSRGRRGTGMEQPAGRWSMAPRWGEEMVGLQETSAGAKAR